jgi:hypothetical protein
MATGKAGRVGSADNQTVAAVQPPTRRRLARSKPDATAAAAPLSDAAVQHAIKRNPARSKPDAVQAAAPTPPLAEAFTQATLASEQSQNVEAHLHERTEAAMAKTKNQAGRRAAWEMPTSTLSM